MNATTATTDLMKCRITWDKFAEEVGEEFKDECQKYCSDLDQCKREVDENVRTMKEMVRSLKDLDELMNENVGEVNPEARQQTMSWLESTDDMLGKYQEVQETFARFRAALPSKIERKLRPSEIILPGENFEEARPFPDAWAARRFPF